MSNVKKYAYNSKTQLTKNINVSELREPTSHKHDILVDIDHINKVQDFMAYIGADWVRFSSGYRCANYCKSRGWSTTSQHTKGKATDQCFKKDGKYLDAKWVCCKAQDFGFKGIGYIDKYYVHLDSRASGTYRGDETKGYSNNVGNDFYKYFGIEKSNTKKHYTGTYPTLPGRGYFYFNPKTPKKIYDKGNQVKNVQKFLNWVNGCKLKVDGYYGEDTFEQVEKFQKTHGLKIDGLFGKDCLAKAKTIVK